MPVDPSILNKYDPPTRPPEPERDGSKAGLVAAIGTPVLLAFAWLADGHPPLIQVFFLASAAEWVLAMAALWYIGYQEDGILGALYARRFPLGSEFAGERPVSWMRFAVGWLLLLAAILCAVLISRTPGAIPDNWLRTRRSGTTIHDQLLK